MGKQVNQVGLAEMVSLLGKVKFREDGKKRGMVRITIVSTSDPAKRKGDKGQLVKTITGNVDLNRNQQKLRAGKGLPPVGGDLPWGEWLYPDSPVIVHKSKYYFACTPTQEGSAGAVGVVCKSSYAKVDGTPLESGSDIVQAIVFKKADGTPFATREETDYGYRVFSLNRASVKLTLDKQTYEYTPHA